MRTAKAAEIERESGEEPVDIFAMQKPNQDESIIGQDNANAIFTDADSKMVFSPLQLLHIRH